MTKECLNDSMTNGEHRKIPRAIGGNSGFPLGLVVPKGLRDNSPAFQRREEISRGWRPEGTVESGSSAPLFQPYFRDLWGQAVPTPIGSGAACPRTTRRNLLHASQFLRCCDWPPRHRRAPAAAESCASAPFSQPPPRAWFRHWP